MEGRILEVSFMALVMLGMNSSAVLGTEGTATGETTDEKVNRGWD